MEMASRHYGLQFGRFLFEFGICGSAGSDHGSREPPFPIWRGTTALLERYYRTSGTAAVGSRYYRYMPSSIISYHVLILVVLFGGLCSFFCVFLLVVCFGSR